MINVRKLEAELWESADFLRAWSKLTSNQYCTVSVFTNMFTRATEWLRKELYDEN